MNVPLSMTIAACAMRCGRVLTLAGYQLQRRWRAGGYRANVAASA